VWGDNLRFKKKFGDVIFIILFILPIFLFAEIRHYESEHLSARSSCCSIIADTSASNDSCRVAYVDGDSAGYMQFGPYEIISPGHYIATFRLKRGNVNTSISPVCVLDITSHRFYPLKYHAIQNIYASSFDSVYKWQDFKVGFYLKDTVDYLQLRIKWLDSIDIYADYIDIALNPDSENIVYAVNLQDLNLDLSTDPFDYEMADRRILLASIQGGINRDTMRLVFFHNDGDYEAQGIYRWLYALNIPYTLVTYDECIEKLMARKHFKGCVLFDPGVPDTSAINDPPEHQKLLLQVKAIATNLAAMDSLLIVTPRTIIDIDLNKFPIKYDLSDDRIYPFLKDLSGEQAFNFNVKLFKTKKYNKDMIFKLFPYISSSPLRNACEKLTDFAIQNRYWCFYKDMRYATDNSFFKDNIFSEIHYLMGWADEGWENNTKYYCKEYEHIKSASKAGKLWIGDMNRIHNLSFFKKLPVDTQYIYRQFEPQIPLLEKKIYISFITMDGDNPMLWFKHYRRDWDSPLRGSIPISWGFPPKLKDLAPAILQYFYKTKTPNDCIIADVSGLAWHLTNHFNFNYFPDMLKVTARYLGELNIRVGKLMADRNNDLVDINYLQKFVDAYPALGGFVEGYWPPDEQGFMMVKEQYPSIRLAVNDPRNDGDVICLVNSIREIINSNPDRPLFLPVIYNIYNSSYRRRTQTLFDKLDSVKVALDGIYGDSIEYIRQDVMMDLVKQYYHSSDHGASLLLNSGFEEEYTHWIWVGNASYDSEKVHNGSASAKLKQTSIIKQRIDIIEGQKYRFKIWLKPDVFSSGIYKVRWNLPDTSLVDTIFTYTTNENSKDWLFYFKDIKAPAAVHYAEVWCECTKGTVWFDDIEVKMVSIE
jgi:hypothetical protein